MPKKRKDQKLPPVRANPPPKGAWQKQISRQMKVLRPPRIGGRKK